jgi:hypothetical protein
MKKNVNPLKRIWEKSLCEKQDLRGLNLEHKVSDEDNKDKICSHSPRYKVIPAT